MSGRTLPDAVIALRFCALIPGLEGRRSDLLTAARILEEAEVARVGQEAHAQSEIRELKEKLAHVVSEGQAEIDRLTLQLEVERSAHRATSDQLERVITEGQTEIDRLHGLLTAVTTSARPASEGRLAAVPNVSLPEDGDDTRPDLIP